jgi:hypothetical protein
MGSKSARREARTAAARERDGELFRRGSADEDTRAHLQSLGQHRFNEVVSYAAAVASRPMHARRAEALVSMGAATSLIREGVAP